MRSLPKDSLAELFTLLAVDVLCEVNEDRAVVVLTNATLRHLATSLGHGLFCNLTFA